MASSTFSFHCIICFDPFEPETNYPVVLPCGHTYVCVVCANRLDKCMECRTPLTIACEAAPPPPPGMPGDDGAATTTTTAGADQEEQHATASTSYADRCATPLVIDVGTAASSTSAAHGRLRPSLNACPSPRTWSCCR